MALSTSSVNRSLAKGLSLQRRGKLPRVPAKHQLEGGRGRRREIVPGDLGGGEGRGDGRVAGRGEHALELIVHLTLYLARGHDHDCSAIESVV